MRVWPSGPLDDYEDWPSRERTGAGICVYANGDGLLVIVLGPNARSTSFSWSRPHGKWSQPPTAFPDAPAAGPPVRFPLFAALARVGAPSPHPADTAIFEAALSDPASLWEALMVMES